MAQVFVRLMWAWPGIHMIILYGDTIESLSGPKEINKRMVTLIKPAQVHKWLAMI